MKIFGSVRNVAARLKFSAREIRAILVLLPFLTFIVVIAVELSRHDFTDDEVVAEEVCADDQITVDPDALTMFEFDPNTVSYEDLRLLGLDAKVAVSIIKYRTAGKVFSIPEDLATCYGVTDSLYARLRPYISIADEFRLKPYGSESRKKFSDSGVRSEYAGSGGSDIRTPIAEFDPNKLDIDGFRALGFSEAQARTIINFRKALGGFRSAAEFAKSYAVTPEMFERLRPFIVIDTAGAAVSDELPVRKPQSVGKIDLNSADSVTLVSVRGIGPKTASAILNYRKQLGGFISADQILQTGSISQHNWELISKQIRVDSCIIHKIDINFAPPDSLVAHPYINARLLRRILHNRQLKGGWNCIEDMIDDNTFTIDEARKLRAYLQFNVVSD